ncbi:MAG: pantoate--beta-alanine ligase [Prevotellaceae bacterium]|jgi:pantoate--beta-alanine ligase|nr:pantoate--beta-alanine ligase [Prevotellaceae bacterium]
MFIVHTVSELRQLLQLAHRQKKTIGLVPTMGALHAGHLSLVQACKTQCALTVTSIFVNPTQFNNPEDLRNYPRTLKDDSILLQTHGVDILFAPGEKEIYPEPDTRSFDFGALERVMEGKFRPGHFNGVAQVVSRLFTIVQPDYAFFGEKDFQQLAIIRALVTQLDEQPVIVGCPVVRENDGLAMSSRNRLLSETQRKQAPLIAATLMQAKEKVPALPVEEMKKWVAATINAHSELEVEYIEIADEKNLQPIKQWDNAIHARLFAAVYARPVRLIDNIRLS